jgi:hypothetical protein
VRPRRTAAAERCEAGRTCEFDRLSLSRDGGLPVAYELQGANIGMYYPGERKGLRPVGEEKGVCGGRLRAAGATRPYAVQ